jgi:hypothetical protein
MTTNQDIASRIRAEYLEMPGMRLTLQQVQRLCGIEPTLCKTALDSLVAAKFLYVKEDGAYARLTDERLPRTRPLKAGVVKAYSVRVVA